MRVLQHSNMQEADELRAAKPGALFVIVKGCDNSIGFCRYQSSWRLMHAYAWVLLSPQTGSTTNLLHNYGVAEGAHRPAGTHCSVFQWIVVAEGSSRSLCMECREH